MIDDPSQYGDSNRPILPLWPYLVGVAMVVFAWLLVGVGDRFERLGIALFLVFSAYCWGIAFYVLREKFRRSATWERRPARWWLPVGVVMLLMIFWPTLLLAALMTDLAKICQ